MMQLSKNSFSSFWDSTTGLFWEILIFKPQVVNVQLTLAANRPPMHSKCYFGAKRSGKNIVNIWLYEYSEYF